MSENSYSQFGLHVEIQDVGEKRVFRYSGKSTWMPDRDKKHELSAFVVPRISASKADLAFEHHVEDLRFMNSSTLHFLTTVIGKTVRTGSPVIVLYDPGVRTHCLLIDSAKATLSGEDKQRMELVPTDGKRLAEEGEG